MVGIETDHGLLATALVAAGYQFYAVNPMSVSRYRDRHHASRAKSDKSDAKLLADLVAPTGTTTAARCPTASCWRRSRCRPEATRTWSGPGGG